MFQLFKFKVWLYFERVKPAWAFIAVFLQFLTKYYKNKVFDFINFKKMVILTVKHATEVQFLFNVPIKTEVSKVKEELRKIYNARLKVERLATEIDQLSQFGTMLPENMQGLMIVNKF